MGSEMCIRDRGKGGRPQSMAGRFFRCILGLYAGDSLCSGIAKCLQTHTADRGSVAGSRWIVAAVYFTGGSRKGDKAFEKRLNS